MGEAAAADLQRVGDVGQRHIGMALEIIEDVLRRTLERGRLYAPTARALRCRVPGLTTSAAGASSSTTCALVPPTPSELTPARRGVSPSAHSSGVVLTKNGDLSKSSFGLGEREVQATAARCRCCSASDSLDERRPHRRPRRGARCCSSPSRGRRTRVSAVCESERLRQRRDLDRVAEGVPVPCASTYEMRAGVDAARSPAPSRSPPPVHRRSGARKLTLRRAVVVDRRALDDRADRDRRRRPRRPAASGRRRRRRCRRPCPAPARRRRGNDRPARAIPPSWYR